MEDGENKERKQRIKIWMALCLIIAAIIVDVLQALIDVSFGIGIVLNRIISPVVSFLFWLWFKLLDVSFTSNIKRFSSFAGGSFVEIIPGLDIIPAFTLMVGSTVAITRSEDGKGKLIKSIRRSSPMSKSFAPEDPNKARKNEQGESVESKGQVNRMQRVEQKRFGMNQIPKKSASNARSISNLFKKAA